ncbi:MAG: glycoside hydrolase family 28 protein [Bacteroides sp.]|nr:glycoside hydrolase family 28 protein [Bacteroides sp.]
MKIITLFRKNSFLVAFSSVLLLVSCKPEAAPVSIPTIRQVGAQAMPEEIAPMENIPFDIPQLQRPQFPDLTVTITERGAVGDSLITDIVNGTIDEVSGKGGGTVIIPAGKWKSGRIVLKSNVNLHIAEGAEVEFPGEAEGYLPAVFTRVEGIEVMGPGAYIYANSQDNIAITGKGTIYGPPMDAEIRFRPNGNSVVENDIPVTLPLEERWYDDMEGRTFYRPKSISPINCTNVLIEGVTLERSTTWNVAPIYCENVIIRGITVNSIDIPSGDGIDIESCKNVLIEYCTLNCGDDCFTLKAGRADDGIRVNRPTENVVIRYSLAKEGHGGVTFGSETAGVVKNVYAHDRVFDGTISAIRFKTRRNRGGGVENIYCERLRMTGIREAFTWDLLGSAEFMGELASRYPPREIDRLTPALKDIYIKDFIAESSERVLTVNGIPESPLKNVVIENGEITSNILIRALNDVDGFTLRNVTIHSQVNEINILDGRNILFDQVQITTPQGEVAVTVEGDKSENIVFIDAGPQQERIEYTGSSPFTVQVNP